MMVLYFLLLLMVFMGLCLLAFPFVKTKSGSYLKCSFLSLFMIASTCLLYYFSGDKQALKLWLVQGQQHYQLVEIFERLGGLEGAIVRIKDKLQKNPNDAEGWSLLAKLYSVQHKYNLAQEALSKLQELDKKNRPNIKNS